eukprot:759058-Hanusia_phi.AAC.2
MGKRGAQCPTKNAALYVRGFKDTAAFCIPHVRHVSPLQARTIFIQVVVSPASTQATTTTTMATMEALLLKEGANRLVRVVVTRRDLFPSVSVFSRARSIGGVNVSRISASSERCSYIGSFRTLTCVVTAALTENLRATAAIKNGFA